MEAALKLVYIAGRYRAPTGWQIDQNIQRAREFGAEVAKMGAMPLVPHANTAHYDGLNTDEFWLAGTLELLKRCDAVMLIPNWEASSGARAEVAYAQENGIPTFQHLIDLAVWLESHTIGSEEVTRVDHPSKRPAAVS